MVASNPIIVAAAMGAGKNQADPVCVNLSVEGEWIQSGGSPAPTRSLSAVLEA